MKWISIARHWSKKIEIDYIESVDRTLSKFNIIYIYIFIDFWHVKMTKLTKMQKNRFVTISETDDQIQRTDNFNLLWPIDDEYRDIELTDWIRNYYDIVRNK